ncbi:hypothetical protein H0Z60_09445 [Ectothiorhodospiraceae bacterium WFHF3C12]|nr:hypothetical protein [Ectothiorhodospiraceae bacterium WFHF3C12]
MLPRHGAARLLVALCLILPFTAGAGVQALVNALEHYADTGETGRLAAQLHPQIRACVPDVERNTIARFILRRVEKQGVAEKVETRAVSADEVTGLRQEAEQMGLTVPVAPTHELRLVYDDYTARLFLADGGEQLRWILPCPGGE